MKTYIYKLVLVVCFFLITGFKGCTLLEILFYTNCGSDPGASFNNFGGGVNDETIMVCDSGKIYISDIMCSSGYSLITVQNEPDLNSITTFFNPGIGNIIVGDYGTLIRIKPDFQLESLSNPAGNQNLNDIDGNFAALGFDSSVVAVGDMGTVIFSSDEGLTWTQLNFPYTYDLVDCYLELDGSIYVTGSDYAFFKTTDNGNTWIPLGPSIENISSGPSSYNRIYPYDDNLWFVAGPHGLILKSVDGGVTWGTRVAQGFSEVTDLYFITPDSGTAVGPGGVARFTTDGGDTWFEDSSMTEVLDGRDVNRIVSFGKYYGIIIGSGGLNTFIAPDSTYLDSIPGVTSVEDDFQIPTEFDIYQNYPNPFNPSTKIRFTVDQTEKTELIIYNVLGQRVATLFNDVALKGKYYEVDFSAGRLASGIYLGVLQNKTKRVSIKMLLIK